MYTGESSRAVSVLGFQVVVGGLGLIVAAFWLHGCNGLASLSVPTKPSWEMSVSPDVGRRGETLLLQVRFDELPSPDSYMVDFDLGDGISLISFVSRDCEVSGGVGEELLDASAPDVLDAADATDSADLAAETTGSDAFGYALCLTVEILPEAPLFERTMSIEIQNTTAVGQQRIRGYATFVVLESLQ